MNDSPSTNGSNGRKPNGRFAAGNKGGPGNPHARRIAEFRSIILAETAAEDIRIIWRMLLERAKRGHYDCLPYVREVLDRLLGKGWPAPTDEPDEADDPAADEASAATH